MTEFVTGQRSEQKKNPIESWKTLILWDSSTIDATGLRPSEARSPRRGNLRPLRPERVIFIFIFYRDILQTPILSRFLEVHSSYLDVSFYHFP